MPKVVVTYFNLRGLGESIRMLLAYGGQEFEDNRVEKVDFDEQKMKTKFPYRQLPVVEIDGKQWAQSNAICRYFAHKFGVAGATLEEDLEIDQVVDFLNDVRLKAYPIFFENDPEAKKKKIEEHWKEHGWMFEKLNEIITKNNGHLACGKLTWADFVFAGVIDAIKFILQRPQLDEEFPAFKKLKESVRSLPKVKEFVAKIPPSEF